MGRVGQNCTASMESVCPAGAGQLVSLHHALLHIIQALDIAVQFMRPAMPYTSSRYIWPHSHPWHQCLAPSEPAGSCSARSWAVAEIGPSMTSWVLQELASLQPPCTPGVQGPQAPHGHACDTKHFGFRVQALVAAGSQEDKHASSCPQLHTELVHPPSSTAVTPHAVQPAHWSCGRPRAQHAPGLQTRMRPEAGLLRHRVPSSEALTATPVSGWTSSESMPAAGLHSAQPAGHWATNAGGPRPPAHA